MKDRPKNKWNKYWSEITDIIECGIVLIGPSGGILHANKAFERITGYRKEELSRKTCDILNCDACERFKSQNADYWCRLFQDPDSKIEACRCNILHKDGLMVPVLKNATVLRDKKGNILGAVEILMDISELERKDKKIEELSRYKAEENTFYGMQGQTKEMRKVFSIIEKAALSDFPVVLYGESGTGKELAAHAIHQLSERRKGTFSEVNCASINEMLLESEFFGHVRGAFTSAYKHRTGRFEAANGGSIFLDEIGDMPIATQAKILRVLESKKIVRVGDNRSVDIDVRFIFATNRDLQDLVRSKHFREDLFFRINVIPLHLPPLRERIDDLPLIVDAIIRNLSHKTGKRITGLSKNALDRCLGYPWWGNVRELKNALQYAFVVAERGLIEIEHLPLLQSPGETPSNNTLKSISEGQEKERLIAALRKSGGNRSEAARILNIARATLWNRIRKYGVQIEQVVKG